MDFNNQQARKEIKKAQIDLVQQREAVIEETRQWVRKWDVPNNEKWYCGFWKKRYGDDKLMNFHS